jgi:Kef-type K+ transport system membrane component KefB
MYINNHILFLMDLSLPLKDPIVIFLIILSVTLFSPLLLGKLRIPGIIGMIIAGVLLGPHGLGVLSNDASISLFGKVGLLYIMFLAGLEVDMNDFKRSRNKSLSFGAATFLIPIIIGTLTTYYFLGLEFAGAILLASMFSSHTLVSYPIVGRLGINRNEIVTVAIGGTIVTDTLVLLVLAVVSNSAKGDLDAAFWLKLVGSLAVFVFIMVWIVPRVTQWFFRNQAGEGGSQYLFVLAIVFFAAFLAELAGVEAIIGAFLAGLALNRLIPHTSPLMNRIEFVGNNLFIPFFLISVGMIVNVAVVIKDLDALKMAGTLVVVALTTKWMAAFLTQKLFGYSPTERNLLFGLTSGHAAATLAIVLVGFNLGLLTEAALNGTILVILVTCLVSSFVTEAAGRKIAITQNKEIAEAPDVPDRILIPVANPESVLPLLDLAGLVRNPESKEPIYALSVVLDDDEARDKVMHNERLLEKAEKYAASMDAKVKVVSRIDLSIASGISRSLRELNISKVVMGWSPKFSTRDRIFGTVLEKLLLGSSQMILVSHITVPIATISFIHVMLPRNAHLEPGKERWMRALKHLAQQTSAKVRFAGDEEVLKGIEEASKLNKPSLEAEYSTTNRWEEFTTNADQYNDNDLIYIVQSRLGFISYNDEMENISRHLIKSFQKKNFIIVYPEQQQVATTSDWEQGYN